MRMTELYTVGQKIEIGSYTFTEERIVHFATRFRSAALPCRP